MRVLIIAAIAPPRSKSISCSIFPRCAVATYKSRALAAEINYASVHIMHFEQCQSPGCGEYSRRIQVPGIDRGVAHNLGRDKNQTTATKCGCGQCGLFCTGRAPSTAHREESLSSISRSTSPIGMGQSSSCAASTWNSHSTPRSVHDAVADCTSQNPGATTCRSSAKDAGRAYRNRWPTRDDGLASSASCSLRERVPEAAVEACPSAWLGTGALGVV